MTGRDARDLVLVLNPRATRAGRSLRGLLVRELSRLGLADVVVSRAPGDAADAARATISHGIRAVVALGGDGTVGEIAGALAGSDVALCPIPGGSTNVFARSLGWPARPTAAIAAVTTALALPARRAHLGVVTTETTQRIFCINAGVGVDAATVTWVEEHPYAKRRLRQVSFALGAAGPGRRSVQSAPQLDVTIGDASALRVAALIAACGAPYAFAGSRPFDLLPNVHHDGPLEWMALLEGTSRRAVEVVARAMQGASHMANSQVIGGLTSEAIHIDALSPVPVQTDGEPLGLATRITIARGPTLRVVSPSVTLPLVAADPPQLGR